MKNVRFLSSLVVGWRRECLLARALAPCQGTHIAIQQNGPLPKQIAIQQTPESSNMAILQAQTKETRKTRIDCPPSIFQPCGACHRLVNLWCLSA